MLKTMRSAIETLGNFYIFRGFSPLREWKKSLSLCLLALLLVLPAYNTGAEIRKIEDLPAGTRYQVNQSEKVRKLWKEIYPLGFKDQIYESVRVIITLDRNGKLEKLVFDKISDNQSLNMAVSKIIFQTQFDPPPLSPEKETYTMIFGF